MGIMGKKPPGKPKSKFAALGNTDPTRKDPYFLAGLYVVQLDTVKIHDGFGGTSFIIRGKIVESTNPTRKEGMMCAQVISLKHASALGNIKAFLAAITDTDMDDPDAMAELDEDFLEENLKAKTWDGTIMALECTMTKTRDGGDFTVHNWSLYKDE